MPRKTREVTLLREFVQAKPAGSWEAPYEVIIAGQQRTDSTNNHWYDWQKICQERPRARALDIGSEFYTRKPWIGTAGLYVDVSARSDTYAYKGRTFPYNLSGLSDDSFSSLETTWIGSAFGVAVSMRTAGATAISRVSPTVPASQLATALGELYKDGLPKLVGRSFSGRAGSGMPIKGTADEYLNYEFAIKPFISDLQKLTKATKEAHRLLERLRANSGKLIRRRYEFPTSNHVIQELNHGSTPYPYRLGNTYFWSGGGSLGTTRSKIRAEQQNWFSGAFTYHFGDTNDRMVDQVKAAERNLRLIYGSVSASTVWNLVPFSWTVDWFTNIGNVISNVDMFSRDGLAMHHGYMMREYRLYKTIWTEGIRFGSSVKLPRPIIDPLVLEYGVISKYRLRASPYGFGVTESSLTARQNAIIAALGFSQLKR